MLLIDVFDHCNTSHAIRCCLTDVKSASWELWLLFSVVLFNMFSKCYFSLGSVAVWDVYASHNFDYLWLFTAIYCNLHDMAGVLICISYAKDCYPIMSMWIYSEVMKHKKHNNSIFKSEGHWESGEWSCVNKIWLCMI